MIASSRYKIVQSPSVHIFVGTDSEFCDAGWALQAELGASHEVRFLRGKKMRNLPDLFDEFAAVLQFPYYFGANWNSFDECIADLSWLPATGYNLLVTNSPYILTDGEEVEFETLMRLLTSVADEWGHPTPSSGSVRLPTPFHIIMHSSPSESESLTTRLPGMPYVEQF